MSVKQRKSPGSSRLSAIDDDVERQFESTTGAKTAALQVRLLEQLYETLWLPNQIGEESKSDRMQAAIDLLSEIRPRDEIEGTLAVQMVATHNAALECLRRAMIPEQSFEGRESNLKHATKLMGIYLQQVAALDRRRGKGHQKVTVEYVNVESGGQAIVGYVEHGRAAGQARRRSGPNPRQVEPPTDEAMTALNKTSTKERSHVRRKERED